MGQRWYARVPVPNRLRKELGPYLRASLDTTDVVEARKRRWDMVPVLRERIERHGQKGHDKASDAGWADLDYNAFRARLRDEVGEAFVLNDLDDELMDNPALDAVIDRLDDVGASADAVAAIRDHIAGVDGVADTLVDYLASNPKRSATTTANYQAAVKLWIKVNGHAPLHRVSRKQVLDWLEDVGDDKAKGTVKRYATVMPNLWEWVWRKEDNRPLNPFDGAVRAFGVKARAAQSYGLYTDDELTMAYGAVRGDPELGPAFMLAIYSGMRLDECIRAERGEVSGIPCFILRGGKTANAARVVPVHPVLQGVPIPSGVKASALSVRYGRIMRSLKTADGQPAIPRGKTFHSLRKAFGHALVFWSRWPKTEPPMDVAVDRTEAAAAQHMASRRPYVWRLRVSPCLTG